MSSGCAGDRRIVRGSARLESETVTDDSDEDAQVEFEHADPVADDIVTSAHRVLHGQNGIFSAFALHVVVDVESAHVPRSEESATKVQLNVLR